MWPFDDVVKCGQVTKKTWQGGGLWQGITTQKFKWIFDHFVTRSHITNKQTTGIYFQEAYSNQMWKSGNFRQGVTTEKVAWPFDDMVMWGHLTNEKQHISTFTMPTATKWQGGDS